MPFNLSRRRFVFLSALGAAGAGVGGLVWGVQKTRDDARRTTDV